MDLKRLEIALKKRWNYPYFWGRKQNNLEDSQTKFIYDIRTFRELEDAVEPLNPKLKNYAMNRWYNFWSAKGIEYIFSTFPNVKTSMNKYDKNVDFTIDGIEFDHKSTVFPKQYGKNYKETYENKRELIKWLYENQSQEGRKHYKNRLFICFYDKNGGEHWKIKAEISIIQKEIYDYIKDFSVNKLIKLNFGDGEIFSDIIWVTK